MKKILDFSELSSMDTASFYEEVMNFLSFMGVSPEQKKKRLFAFGVHFYNALSKHPIETQNFLSGAFIAMYRYNGGSLDFSIKIKSALGQAYLEWLENKEKEEKRFLKEAMVQHAIRQDLYTAEKLNEFKNRLMNFSQKVNGLKKIIQKYPNTFSEPGPKTMKALLSLMDNKRQYQFWLGAFGNVLKEKDYEALIFKVLDESARQNVQVYRWIKADFRSMAS